MACPRLTRPPVLGGSGMYDWPRLEQLVADRLQERRLRHVQGVVATALYLAGHHGINPDQARAAALLHDFLRNTPGSELQAMAVELGVAEPDPEDNRPDILHGPVAAARLAADGLVTDADVLGAIRWHTTGRSQMSPLEMVVWLADKLEPGRTFPWVERLRETVATDLEGTLLAALDETLLYLVEKGQRIHLATVQCRNWLVQQRREGATAAE